MDTQLRALTRQARALGRSQRHNSWALRHLSGQLHEQIRQARMVPAETVFEGFRRMVRDIARDEGKQVEFQWTGWAVEADRMVLQALKDPLMHLLRNAVCHGIEPPEERLRAAKPAAGALTLRLETRGNRLLAAVEDDGRGIDLQAVLRVAVQRHFVSEAEARSRSPDELARLIFQPGFSTSPSVTDLSGRGMGLSVVEQQVRRLHGELNLEFRDRPGACFTLLAPLTVFSQRFLLVACAGQKLAIPLHSIERLHRVAARAIETVEGKAVFPYEGRPLPLTSLADLLDLTGQPAMLENGSLPVMVLRSGETRLGVVVESFLVQHEAIVRDLGLQPPHAGKSAGGILLDDGTVAVVLSAAGLVAAGRRPELGAARFAVAPAQEKKSPVVLVVDDSITTRSLEKAILETHGYTVRVAVDGVEALEQLRAQRADLVITDIQMPRMDGYALLQEIKKDTRLADIPVIVVTSMERREEQERGLLLGADAYVVKRKFDQHELLEAIRQIV
jgi:two-component system chemotaxis sensor kinase CheA